MNSIADRLRRIVRPATAHGVGGPQQGDESEEPDPSHGSRSRGAVTWTPQPFSTVNGRRPARIASSLSIAATHLAIVMDLSRSLTACLRKKAGPGLACLPERPVAGSFSSSTSRQLESPAVQAAMRSSSDAAGSIAAAFTSGSISCPASRQSVPSRSGQRRCRRRRCGRHLQRQVVRPSAHRDSLLVEPIDDAVCGYAARGHASSCEAALAWRRRGHRLSSLETSLLGHEREGDVPGFEIPARYFRYVHTGDARPLGAVLEHNRLDLLSLALLTARAAQMLDEGVTSATTAREALGIGRLYERAGMTSDALACFARAADMGPGVCPDALYAHAVLLRRLRRYEAAASAWQRLLDLDDCPSRLEREAAEALAVHYEHRLRSLPVRAPPGDAIAVARHDPCASRGNRAPGRAIGSQARAQRACTASAFLSGMRMRRVSEARPCRN